LPRTLKNSQSNQEIIPDAKEETMPIDIGRIKYLNHKESQDNPYVVYWMQSSQRVFYNHALQYAIGEANKLEKPLLVYFGLTDSFPDANERHYRFMLEGLQEVQSELERMGIQMVIRRVSPEKGALEMASLASILVVDRGYLRIEKAWRSHVAQHALCPIVQIESNVIVPVEHVSDKEEYAAATIRRKIHRLLPEYAHPLEETRLHYTSLSEQIPLDTICIDDIDLALAQLDLDRSVGRSTRFTGGTQRARQILDDFILTKLSHYVELKNEPGEDYVSNLSPYLHFGQISPLEIYLRIGEIGGENAESYLEELVIRRELSMNYVHFQKLYDSYAALPLWARNTLEKHLSDRREYVYTLEELELSKTHDPYWNTAQKEMVQTGKMHGYMRMYWGKKILEWNKTPQEAFNIALYLNNKYLLDGRDPNGYAGVAWCFGKHDRPWGERAIFGNVRYMNDKGLKRKFNMDKYIRKVEG
jgi:deoxyribodipyrimidine photo-lyase